MFSTIRSRIWLGYLLLTVVVIAALVLGLVVALGRSPLLYRGKLQTLAAVEEKLLQAVQKADSTKDPVSIIQTAAKNDQKNVRILVLDASGSTLYDSEAGVRKPIVWRSVALIDQTSASSFNVIRDTRLIAWMYIGQQLANGDYLVVADQRGNPSLALLLSDPMGRTVFRVFVIAVLLSLLLTLLLERWVSHPIAQIAAAAKHSTGAIPAPIKVAGPKEVQDLATALNEMNRKVSESQQSQRDFVSNVSHELKTPLTSISGFSQAILDGTASSETDIKHAAQVIQNESSRMYRLVTDLLMLARLEGGAEKSNVATVDLAALIQTIIDRFMPLATKAQITLVNNLKQQPPVTTDADQVTQIINNLVENALKFSPPQSTVAISSSISGNKVLIAVTDHGVGISEIDQKKIFDRFYQVDRSRSKTGFSSGLGLPIARQLARNLGGDLQVSSRLGEGSTFVLSLPSQLTSPVKKS